MSSHVVIPPVFFILAFGLSCSSCRSDAVAKAPAYPTIGSCEAMGNEFWELIPRDAKIEVLAEGFVWSEGPVWIKEKGYLLFSDVPTNMIYKWEEGEGHSIFMRPSGCTKKTPAGREPGSNGLAVDHAGRLVLCEHGDRRVSRLKSLDEPNGAKTTLADRYEGKRFNSPNDLAFHSSGDLYFTDPPYGLDKNDEDPLKELGFHGVFRISKDGEVTLLTSEIQWPNGIAFSPDEETLYVASSNREKPQWYAFDVRPDGSLSNQRNFHDPAPWRDGKKGSCDGMKVDARGNVFATGPGGVCVFAPDGRHLGTIKTPVSAANCAFGGDGTVLYITADMYLLRIRTKTKGTGF